MNRPRYRAPAVVATLVSVLAVCLSPAAAEEKPVLHLLAPSEDYANQYDPLIAESALRLVAAELAARHGTASHFWPADHLQRVRQDAYPRVEITSRVFPRTPHLRLRRRGNVFDFFASPRGRSYVHIARYVRKLPAKTHVGIMFPASWSGRKTVTATVSDVRLNGDPFRAYRRADIGECYKPGEVSREGDKHTVTTHGFEPKGNWRERGPFLYRTCDGDFEIAARVDNIVGEGGYYGLALMCRTGLEPDAESVALLSLVRSVHAAFGGPTHIRMRHIRDLGAHAVVPRLLTGADEAKPLASVPATYVSWEQLTRSIDELAEAILEGLKHEGIVPKTPPAGPRLPTPAQQGTLAGARKLALKVSSGEVLAAAGEVDQVLNSCPTCPQAHFTAALCGALLACQDVYGAFHERGRYLAGPVSHMLLARRLGGAVGAGERLSEAWVRLACGYPRAAMEALESIPPDKRNSPEARALAMFITEDHRALTEQTVLGATPIEQLAWIRATQSCGLDESLQTVPARLARDARTCALLPLYRSVGVGPGHTFSRLRIILAFARDASDLLTCPDIPAQKRRAIGRRMARALRQTPKDDLRELARVVAWAAFQRGLGEDPADALAPLTELYLEAMALPVGPTAENGGIRWRSISVHDFAELQRGLLVRTVYRRVKFLGSMLGVPEETEKFCRRLAEGMREVPGAGEFFRAMGDSYLGQAAPATASLKAFLNTRAGRAAAGLNWAAPHFRNIARGVDYALPPGRGTWEWQKLCELSDWIDGRRVHPYAYLALGVDDHAADVFSALSWRAGSVDPAERFRARMEYDTALMTNVAYYARYFGQEAEAKRIYERLIELRPKDVTNYRNLAHWYYGNRQTDKGIEVCQRAADECEYTVGLSNLLGTMAEWLIEQNRPEEALAWGRIASRSYSYRGLAGLGLALAANGMVGEALVVFRRAAERYSTGTHGLTQLILQEKLGFDRLSEEIQSLVKLHQRMRDKVAEAVSSGCVAAGGDCASLERLYEGPLSFVPLDERARQLMVNAVYQRRFDAALDHAGRLARLSRLSADEAILAHAARRLTKRQRQTAWVDEQLRLHLNDRLLAAVVKHCLGEIPLKDLPQTARRKGPRAYRFFLIGVEAERKNDLRGAIGAYEQARWLIAPSFASRVPRRWIEILKPDAPTTGQAAKGQ